MAERDPRDVAEAALYLNEVDNKISEEEVIVDPRRYFIEDLYQRDAYWIWIAKMLGPDRMPRTLYLASYGPGEYLYFDKAADGKVAVDFRGLWQKHGLRIAI
jgi:hypothetical protein